MAIITNFYSVDNQIAADLNNPQTSSTSTPDVPGPRNVAGDICQGIGGSQWVFVKASTTVTAFNVVEIDEAFNANNVNFSDVTLGSVITLQKTLALAEFQVSVANAGDYFWAMLAGRGGALVNVQSTAAANTQLYISSSVPGSLTTTVGSTVTNAIIYNCAVNSSLLSTTAAVELIFAYMRASV
jgi:hypothetical protein